ncbi:hypothetical protein TcasGA2_TC035012 [Tribolium castaneum]|uniref:Uncharacterized protein n=1 Tax=Tribolium castaneum TaxID=7070 RepID=A0A139W919_TRICA|nr:hypothetical protein TcasGA2_TC035012 [Tribolium castaneum]
MLKLKFRSATTNIPSDNTKLGYRLHSKFEAIALRTEEIFLDLSISRVVQTFNLPHLLRGLFVDVGRGFAPCSGEPVFTVI